MRLRSRGSNAAGTIPGHAEPPQDRSGGTATGARGHSLVWPDLPGCIRVVHVPGAADCGIRTVCVSPPRASGAWSKKDVEDILFLGVLGVVAGGRLGYCLFYKPGYYLSHPLEVLFIWQGGMRLSRRHAGRDRLAVVVCASRQRAVPGRSWTLAPCVPTGLASGRAKLHQRRAVGPLCSDPALPWGMVFPQSGSHAAAPSVAGVSSSCWKACCCSCCLAVRAQTAQAGGGGSVSVRLRRVPFVAEFFREPDAFLGLLALNMSMGQWLCVPHDSGRRLACGSGATAAWLELLRVPQCLRENALLGSLMRFNNYA